MYGALDPRLGPGLGLDGGLGGGLGGDGLGGGEDVLRAAVRALRDQLDAVTRRLGGRTSLDDRDVL